ncbi:MAG: DNA-directed RNA polymerase subunit beta', partial [Ruminococcaceae bacterium]|nr:DNA-directed RNA polymerase subunit beta' [Oscillospiraceae bacterium]
KVRVTREIDGVEHTGIIDATLGRLIFNREIPQDLGFVDRSDPAHLLDLEIAFPTKKKDLGKIIDRCIKKHGVSVTAQVLDSIKAMGFKYSTKSSLSISVADMTIPPEKYTIVADAEKEVLNIMKHFQRGRLSEDERYNSVIKIWDQATKDVVDALLEKFDRYNPIKMMSDSGARGNLTQMRQLAGMRGLMFATNGKTMEMPIKSNFREGLNILEYFVAARGARKSLSDTALKTADSGYLTRRLVDVSQDVIVREQDCGTRHGIWVSKIVDGNEVIEPLKDRLIGRFAIGDVIHPETGAVLAADNTMITDEQADAIVDAGIEKVLIRTILECKAKHGVCSHCYGADLASSNPVNVGEAVGIIAAQSIGEPGTQLTMRTFHTGGVAGADITQGLPRVEELFEARRPKKTAIVAEVGGVARITENKRIRTITVSAGGEVEDLAYQIPFGVRIVIEDGQTVAPGQPLTEGSICPTDILRINGLDAAYDYIIREVQKVYRLQSVEVNDKHIEVIARQMTRKTRVEDAGDTTLLAGSIVDLLELERENAAVQARIDAGEVELRLAIGSPVLLGITKAALLTDSFLSAASFQETTKVLTEAAIRGKVDNLLGLKENVIIGKLIPAGTGMECYRNIEVEKEDDQQNAIIAD